MRGNHFSLVKAIFRKSGTFTWTAPNGVYEITVEAWGAGGGGGSSSGSTRSGAGGGGGAYSKILKILVSPGKGYTVTVGAGGTAAAGSNGGNGGNSSFISTTTLLAKGGVGGERNIGIGANGGAGGDIETGVGDIKYAGGAGGSVANVSGEVAGGGGGAAGNASNGQNGADGADGGAGGLGGTNGGGSGGNIAAPGNPGLIPGGGGSGGNKVTGGDAGGVGAVGQVIITYKRYYFFANISGAIQSRIGSLSNTFFKGFQKPLLGAQIDIRHPLVSKLTHCWIFNENKGNKVNDLIGNRIGLLSGETWLAVNNNPVIFHDTISDQIDFGNSDVIIPTNNCTIILAHKKSDATNRQSTAFGPAIAGNDANSNQYRCTVHLPWSDGVVVWQFGGTVGGSNQVSYSGDSSGYNIWTFTTGVRGMEIWKNTLKVASNTSLNPTRSATGVSFMLNKSFTDYNGDLAYDDFLYIYNRQITEAEIRWINREPFSFIQPPLYKRYFFSGNVPAAVPPPPVGTSGDLYRTLLGVGS